MRYQATVVTAPEFELPDYSSIPAEIAKQKVTEERRHALAGPIARTACHLSPVEGRALADGRLRRAHLRGQPRRTAAGEAVPDAPAQLQGRRNAWIFMARNRSSLDFARPLPA